MSNGLYIGRFQPFHLGHLSAIKQALQVVEKLYIGIGSSQYNHTNENPFTAEERQKMIELALKEAELEARCEIFLIPDIHDEEKWVDHVKKIVSYFEIVFVGNEGIVKNLFEKRDIKVVMLKQELNISASKIRQLMKEGGQWEKSVSTIVAQCLKFIQAEDRIKKFG